MEILKGNLKERLEINTEVNTIIGLLSGLNIAEERNLSWRIDLDLFRGKECA